MLILILYNFLTISEILKEKKNQTNNKKPNQKKIQKKKNFKCQCIHKTQTILFKLFLHVNYPSNKLSFMLT